MTGLSIVGNIAKQKVNMTLRGYFSHINFNFVLTINVPIPDKVKKLS